ncbi:hypothetical protein SLEP1_g42498 [Rubroshorea leprosula]|uniref:Integrase catalytic domain-containing protein n=1 Tax=Rubroshorea leprosula TaxID=152421 RepID=A0AAV5LAX7_9ROSI|nr:hypothetical protein SLEP1_g42498 [Rubroshorea leprosula]
MVNTRSIRAGNQAQPLRQGQGQYPNNLPPHLPPQIPNLFPFVEHAEGGDENQPHNLAHNSASTPNQGNVVTTQLAAMQQQFGVFQIVLAQLLARNNPGDPLINLLNLTQQPPVQQQDPQLVQHAPALSESQGQSHVAPVQQPLPNDVTRRLDSLEKLAAKQRVKQRDGESLKNYMSRFNDAILEVSSFNQAIGIAAVIQGLQHERFGDSLIKHPAATFNEVNDRSLKFITTEEYALSQKPFLPKNQNLDWKDEGQSRKWIKTVQSREQLKFVREQGPQPQRSCNVSNRQGVGHQQASPPLPPPARIIHMITGGLEARGLSSKQQKLYIREMKRQNRAQKRKFNDVDWNNQPITFTPADFDAIITLHNDPLLTSIMINSYKRYDGPIYGFNNQPVQVEGVFTLNVAFGSSRTYVTPSVQFLVIKMASFFNVVIGRPTLIEIRAVVSQSHLYMKFPTPMGIATLQEIIDNRPEDETRATPVEDVEEVQLHDRYQNRTTQIGTRLNPKERTELIAFLRANKDVFAWTSVDMPGVPTSVIKEKVEKLLQAGFVKRVDYYEWVANPVLVKQANGKWRMCIDYTNLDQACPKDCYSMPSIDKLVEAASKNERLSLLDAYSGYHQVPIAPEDEEKTFFYAGDEIYCYVMMPFGLKNTGATYQKMVTIVFRAQIGKNLQVHVDDIVAIDGEILYLHLGISNEAISSVLVREEGKQQKLIYYTSSVLHKAKLRYPIVEKVALAVITSARKLRLYFQSHPIIVLTDQPLQQILPKLECSRSIGAKSHSHKSYSDSQLVVNQVNSVCKVVDLVMMKYVALVAELKCKFQKFCLSKIPRSENEQADSLSKFASDSSLSYRSIFVEVLDEPSFMKPRMMEISTDPNTLSWIDPIVSFLRNWSVPADKQEEIRLRKKASRYTLIDRVLYKRSFSLSLLRCLNPYEVEYALREVHEGVCGSHIGARTLAHKVLRQGYYWSNMYKDATHFVQKCSKCQFFAHLTHQPVEELTNLVALWSFALWGLDLLGPFMKGVGGVTHLIVGVDYFTKWVEARPLSSLTSKKVEDFVFSSIICRYGILNQIIADNGTQFNCSSFRDFCSNYRIKLQFT